MDPFVPALNARFRVQFRGKKCIFLGGTDGSTGISHIKKLLGAKNSMDPPISTIALRLGLYTITAKRYTLDLPPTQ